jgi:hypothetical protein
LVLHAEIYPSVRDSLPDEIKDRGQVRAMWQWARDLDRDNLLWREFCRPIEVETGSKEDLAIQLLDSRLLTTVGRKAASVLFLCLRSFCRFRCFPKRIRHK